MGTGEAHNKELVIDEEQTTVKRNGPMKEAWRRLRKSVTAMIGLGILAVFVFLAIFADVIADYETVVISMDGTRMLQRPSLEHLMGTDHLGRDIFARIVHGARVSLTIGLFVTGFAVLIGGFFGASTAYWGGLYDMIIMRICDILLSIPGVLLGLAIIAVLGPSLINLLIALVIANIPIYTRFIRSTVLTIVEQDFIEAARACGTSDLRIIYKHIITNVTGPIIVQATLSIAATILSAAGFSFLGMGIAPPHPEWGAMLADARGYLRTDPHFMIFPGIAIILTALSFNLVGDGLRDALDPRLKT
ncbi:MAG: ABC transporter permease [Defluviitaleaceae bacterium]|nr:ABC transporter permease [Defluviitaleaceae bacterium]